MILDGMRLDLLSHDNSKLSAALDSVLDQLNKRDDGTVEAWQQSLVEWGIVGRILRELNKGDMDIAEKALSVLRELTLSEIGRNEIVAQDGVGSVVAFIKSDCQVLKFLAVRIAFNMSVVSPSVRNEITESHVLENLIEMITLENECQCAVVGTLANLATEVETKRTIVSVYHGLAPLLEVLSSEDLGVLTHACRALFALAANDDNKLEIREAGGLGLLLNCLNVPCESVRMNAAGALANLAIHPGNKLKLVEAGILSYLREFALSTNIKILRQVARCLFALAAHVDNRHRIIEENCLPSILHLMRSQNTEVQINAAGAIGNIAMSDEYKLAVVTSGALARLLELAATGVPKVQRQSARAIFTLSARDSIKSHLLPSIDCLVSMCDSPNEDIRRDAAGAIANMAIGVDYKEILVKHNVLPPLIRQLSSCCHAVQRQSTRALFALAGNAELQKYIVESGAVEPLVALLESDNEDVQRHAAGAVANIATHYPDIVIKCGGLTKMTQLTCMHSSVEVRRQSFRGISNLTCTEMNQSLGDICKYSGINGEQQRLRHEMRKLFEETLAFQINHASAKVQVYDLLGNNATIIPKENVSANKPPSFLERKGRKRSCEDLLVHFYPFGNSKVIKKKKTSGTEFDVRLVLPIDAHSEEKNQSFGMMVFLGHACILSARSTVLVQFIEQAANRNDRNDDDLNVRVPIQYTASRDAWMVVLEYLYTDSIRMHVSMIQNDEDFAREVIQHATNLRLPRIKGFCHMILPSLGALPAVASTWGEDMSKLLDYESSFLPDLSDVDMTLSPEFQTAVPKPSPRHANFTFPGSPKCKDSPTKRLKTLESSFSKPRYLVQNNVFGAHQVLLSARCNYFGVRFKDKWVKKESGGSTVTFDGTQDAMNIILRYIYCGMDKSVVKSLNEDPSLALQVLVIANEYSLEGLQLQCECCLLKWVNASTVAVLLQELEMVNAPILKTTCMYHYLNWNQPEFDSQLTSRGLIEQLETAATRWGIKQ